MVMVQTHEERKAKQREYYQKIVHIGYEILLLKLFCGSIFKFPLSVLTVLAK